MTVKKKMALFLNDSHIIENISNYLYKQLDEGMVLVDFDRLHFHFDKTNQRYTYAIEERTFENEADENEYIEMFKEYGYEYIGKESSMYDAAFYYFKKLGEPDYSPSYTQTDAPNYKKDARFLIAIVCLLIGTDVMKEIAANVDNLVVAQGFGIGANAGKIIIYLIFIRIIFNLTRKENAQR